MKLKYVFLMLSIAVIIFIFFKQYDFGRRWRIESMVSNSQSGAVGNSQSGTMPGAGQGQPGQGQPGQGQPGPGQPGQGQPGQGQPGQGQQGKGQGQQGKEVAMTGIESSIDPSDAQCNVQCSGDYTNSKNLPLKEYCVKASFNSAYNGTDVSKDTITKRIQEGYRFIDLNVYPADNEVFVGFSPDNAPKTIQGKLLLSDALKEISEKAFTRDNQFNPKLTDLETLPMFVHIRVYRAEKSVLDIISKVATIINGVDNKPPPYSANYLRNDGIPEQIDGCTPLSTISGKIIFSMDILNILEIYAPPKYQSASNVPTETINAMQSFVNILSGGSTFPAYYRYTEGALSSSSVKLGLTNESLKSSMQTNTKHLFIAFPHPDDVSKGAMNQTNATGVVHPNIRSFILDHSIQFTPLRVYLEDTTNKELTKYKNLFDDIGTPFAPMLFVYRNLS